MLSQQLDAIETGIAQEQALFEELKEAIVIEQEELQDLYKIKKEAESLDALIIANKKAKEQLENANEEERLRLQEDVEALGEVTVVAERSTIQQRIDRKVITVGKDLITAGPTASDIMNNLPSVSVDQQTGDISLRGNSNVRVMVDGKFTNVPAAQLLKQIPSNSIKQIELITNPSAKYNPEGMSGIINIVLHKNTLVGFNGSFNVGFRKEIKPNPECPCDKEKGIKLGETQG